MRQIMRQCFDLFLVQRIGDIGHRRHAAARAHAGFVIVQRLNQILLALAGDARNRFGPRIGIGMT